MKAIIYPQANGNLGIIYPAPNISIDEATKFLVAEHTPYKVVDSLNIDREFFDAYEYTEDGPWLNISKAHKVWKDKWRQARNAKLKTLDTEFLKAVETGNTNKQQEIAKQKQQLRDLTNLALPDTLESVKLVWPKELR